MWNFAAKVYQFKRRWLQKSSVFQHLQIFLRIADVNFGSRWHLYLDSGIFEGCFNIGREYLSSLVQICGQTDGILMKHRLSIYRISNYMCLIMLVVSIVIINIVMSEWNDAWRMRAANLATSSDDIMRPSQQAVELCIQSVRPSVCSSACVCVAINVIAVSISIINIDMI